MLVKRGLIMAVDALLLAACAGAPALDDRSLESALVELERESWRAWKAQDAAFFDGFLSEDHVELGAGGPADKRAVIGFIQSGACHVASYTLTDFHLTRLSETSAVLVYRARQETTCGGGPVPSPAWATSVFAWRDGRWRNVLYQQLPEESRK